MPSAIVRVEQLDTQSEDEELLISVPCWMLDEQACAHLTFDGNSIRISLDALLQLRTLVDSGLMMVQGDHHESTKTADEDVAGEATNS